MARRRSLLFLLAPAPAFADPALRMAYFDRGAPLSERNAQGRMQGLLIDLIEAVGAQAGLRFEHQGFPWARAQAMVERGELDGLCTTRTAARERYLLFCSTALLGLRYGLLHRHDDARIPALRGLAGLRELRVGSTRGSGYKAELAERIGSVHYDNDPDSVLRRIALGDLDLSIDSELGSRQRLRALGLQDRVVFSAVDFLPPAEYRWGLRRSHPQAVDLLARMERATRAARAQGRLAPLIERYRQA